MKCQLDFCQNQVEPDLHPTLCPYHENMQDEIHEQIKMEQQVHEHEESMRGFGDSQQDWI